MLAVQATICLFSFFGGNDFVNCRKMCTFAHFIMEKTIVIVEV